MRIHQLSRPDPVDVSISARVERDIAHALNSIVTIGNKFVVNDTLWFRKRADGNIRPCVMNMAGFISSKFQNTLRDDGLWQKDATFVDQEIDAYIELEAPGKRLRIPPDGRFIEFFGLHFAKSPALDLRKEFIRCWHNYVRVGINGLEQIDAKFRRFFKNVGDDVTKVKIGLEFETGNIASSFRALGKLESLFVTEHIDYGVFITSIDKERAAARIWPSSNRNGSFTELRRRNYRANLTVPLWEFGFEPDAIDRAAPYFNNDSVCQPITTNRKLTVHGTVYEVFRRESEKLLRPIILQQNLDSDAP